MHIWRYLLSLALATPTVDAVAPGEPAVFRSRLVTVDGSTYPYQVFVPPTWSSSTRWPVILALHGGGGYGSDGVRQTTEGLGLAIRRHPHRFPALVVFPQSPANGTPGWQAIGGRIALAALADAQEEFSGDRSRVTLTGLSVGGNGAWFLAYHHPDKFAGLLVVCGFVAERKGVMHRIVYPSLIPGVPEPSARVAHQIAHIPTWVFHGDADRTVPVEHSRTMVAALRGQGAKVKYDELAGVDHNAWDIAYDRPEVIKWLLSQTLDGSRK